MINKPVALITGASRGIGAATASEFARRGYLIAVTAPAEESLDHVPADLRISGDLTNLDFVRSLVPRVIEKFGRLDVLVNNAAWRELVTMREMTQASWDKTLQICLTAPALLAQGAGEVMERQRRGVIINVSSIMSSRATAMAPAYVAAKGAIDSLTYNLAALLGPRNVRVVAVAPGAIDTQMSLETAQDCLAKRNRTEEMIPLRRWGTADEVARTIAMLASDDASYITGTTIVVDGGWQHQLYSQEDRSP